MTEEEFTAFMAACSGNGFLATRDAALFSFMFDTIARSSEALSPRAKDDIDTKGKTAVIRKGKNQKTRLVAYSKETALRMATYRMRRNKSMHAHLEAFWLSQAGALTKWGLDRAFHKRRMQAELPDDLTPHSLRRGGAVRLKLLGIATDDLMVYGGWNRITQVMEYVEEAQQELAITSVQKLFDSKRKP
jgi:integrase